MRILMRLQTKELKKARIMTTFILHSQPSLIKKLKKLINMRRKQKAINGIIYISQYGSKRWSSNVEYDFKLS